MLNRVVRVTEDGWEYEADQRHADLLVEGLGLEKAKSVLTPGEKTKSILENDSELQGMDHRMYRALAARANYLALDRPDIQFATKEICRAMSNPTKSDWLKLKRLGRYLIDSKRLVAKYPWQETQELLKKGTQTRTGQAV